MPSRASRCRSTVTARRCATGSTWRTIAAPCGRSSNAGREGEIYNIGGNRSLPNLEVVRRILAAAGAPESLIQYVEDRPGHDRRYALSSAKVMRETGWAPEVPFEEGLALTVEWYRRNRGWVERVRSGEYQAYYERNYGSRLRTP